MQLGQPTETYIPPVLERLRRVHLRKLFDANNIPYDEATTTAKSMRLTVEEKGLDYMNFDFTKTYSASKITKQVDQLSETAVQMEARIRAEILGETQKTTSLEPIYQDMTRAQLMKTCKEKGIPLTIHDKKKDLIEKLNG